MRSVRTNRRRLRAWGAGLAATATLMGAAALSSPAQAAEGTVINAGVPGAIEGQYIVALEGGTSLAAGAEAQVAAQAEELVDRYGGSTDAVFSAALRGFAAEMTAEQAKRLAADPEVRYVQQSLTVKAAGLNAGPLDGGTQPNPPSYGLDRIDGELDEAYDYPGTGSGVTAYVLDSGIRLTHETFEGRASYGYDFVDEDPEAQDCHGHGTHVAGTIGGEEYGVAKDVELVALRVLGCDGTAPDRDAIEALDWVAQNADGPSVGNMSLTSGGANAEPQALREATRGAIQAGTQFAIAAGNAGRDACGISPGDTPEAVTLGATTRSDGRAGYSNYGSCLDLFAPGSNITSASHTSDTGTATMSGTSMASPHAAGAIALYLEGHPDASPQESRDALVEAAQSGVVGDPGSGSPNLLLNVSELGAPSEPGKPVAEFSADCSATEPTCSFDASASTDDTGIASYAWTFGDGQTGGGATPTHTYAGPGSYEVTLTVTDDDGKTDTATRNVTAGDPPDSEKPQASFTTQCGWQTGCTFDASASTDNTGIASYTWDFGDGTTGTGETTQHSYTTAGTHTVTLTVTDAAGQTDTATRTLQCYDFGDSALCFPN